VSLSRATIVCLAFLLSSLVGCGGDNSSYLPQPRPADDDEATPVVAAPAPAAASSAEPVTRPAAEVAAQPAEEMKPAEAAVPAKAATEPAKEGGSSDAASPPATTLPLNATERRRRTVEQLTQIGRTFEAYRAKHGTYPPRVVFSLSWRVGILPHAGQADLYLQFSRSDPWDHAHNRKLLTEIPSYLQSGDPDAAKTRMVMVSGENSADAASAQEGLSEDTCPDGLDDTILAVAVSDPYAVPWTSPQDYAFSRETLPEAFFGLYQDCCYALFGGGAGVRRIPATISDQDLLALLTPAGGESVSALDVTLPPTPEPDEGLLRRLQDQPLVRFVQEEARPATEGLPAPPPGPTAATTPVSSATPIASHSGGLNGDPVSPLPPGDSRLPIPDEVSQQLARRLLREAHHQEYAEAKTDDRKKKLADKLLAQARTPDLDPAGRYVALELSRKIAIEGGGIPKALESVELMTQAYRSEGFAERTEILAASVGRSMPESDSERVLGEATKWLDLALERDELDLADQSLAAALAAARRLKDMKLIGTLTPRKKEISDARAARREAADYLDRVLQDPVDPQANEVVGMYYCLIKQRWDDGLPLLARAADPRLNQLAELEAKRPATPGAQLALADRWWTYAESSAKHRSAIRARAAHWYRQALIGLPPGLERIKAESRLAKAEPRGSSEQGSEPLPER
jgi:hypothetical protein